MPVMIGIAMGNKNMSDIGPFGPGDKGRKPKIVAHQSTGVYGDLFILCFDDKGVVPVMCDFHICFFLCHGLEACCLEAKIGQEI